MITVDERGRQMTTGRPGAPVVPLTFSLPGFSKCGTTSLISLVAQHPEVAMPSRLEPWFFINDRFDSRWDGYRRLFPDDLHAYRAVGDDSTSYTSSRVIEATSTRLANLYPDLRLVFLARDPVARIESSFREFHHSGPKFGINTPFDLGQALEELPQIVRDSRYWYLIGHFRDRFPSEQIKVVFFEDFVRDPSSVLRTVFDFIGVSPDGLDVAHTAPRLNRGERKLRDTRVLRRLRLTPVVGQALCRMHIERHDRALSRMGLRRPDTTAPTWTPKARQMVRDTIGPDAAAFLAAYGGPASGWPRLAEVMSLDSPGSE